MSDQEKVKVEVTVGPATVRIEASPDKLEEALINVISALKSLLPQLRLEEKPSIKEGKAKSLPTCSILLKNLMDEGWFDKPRTLSETVQELARRGYNYDSTAVSHSLLDLVRERALVREGTPRRYTYYKALPGTKNLQSPNEQD
ncbi:MAG: hypothetical protein NZ929_00675 [Aigarchaeota archaeon]|nr:hypothetical protein [Aigarchaeota archaeon]MCX8193216.1 hypothetical protein [Nitrososphaeria archaeon]MDW7986357.1 hypothetical protein [Nitrososphaerota archaeon]